MEHEVLLCSGELLARYGFPGGHPFSVHRQQAFLDEALQRGLLERVGHVDPRLATHEELVRFHTEAHVQRVVRHSHHGQGWLDQGDTPAFPGCFEAASAVGGSALAALASVMSGEALRSFQPIGGLHHARPGSAAGFCVFNDIGIVIETLRSEYGVRRIAYVDIDVHHGDGVFYPYEDDAELTVVDVHEDGHYLYPGTGHAHECGTGEAAGTKLNLPLLPRAHDADFREAWVAAEELLRFQRPEIILLQCGADSLAGDPLAHLLLTPDSHAYATQRLCRLANEVCEGRLMAFGGGGYSLINIGHGWSAVLDELLRGSWR